MSDPAWPAFPPGTSAGWWAGLWLFPVLFSIVYWLLTARWLRRRFRKQNRAIDAPEPAVFFRPVKRGVPELEEKAARLLAAARPGDQVLFGVDCEEDAHRCHAACCNAPPGVEWRIVPCPLPDTLSPNPKITKLTAMAPHALPECRAWILTDSEALLERDFMDRFRAEWVAEGGVLTAGYRFTGESNLPQRFDHLSVLLTFWPGLVAAERGGSLRFTLGACTAFHREALDAVGGWDSFAPYLAEDHHLGNALARHGLPVRLAREVLVLDSDPLTWGGFVRHQHRMALTYRVCNFWGTLGMGLTHGISFALLVALAQPASPFGWGLLALAVLVRTGTARSNAKVLGIHLSAPLPRLTAGILAASLMETFFWLAAWLPLPVRWGNRRYRVFQGGGLREIPPRQNFRLHRKPL